jgi:hypothetical protein
MSNIKARAGMLRLAADYEVMAQRAQEWFDASTHPMPKGDDHAHAGSSADVVFRAFDRHRSVADSRM